MLQATHPSDRVAEFEAAGLWRDETLATWMTRWVREFPQRPAVVSATGVLSYSELWNAAINLAGGLRRLGLQPGEVVAVQLPNCAEFVISYLAISFCGAVMQTLHMPYRSGEIGPLLNHSRAAMAIVPARIKEYSAAEVLMQLRGEVPALRKVIVVGAQVAETDNFTELLHDDAGADRSVRSVSHEPFLLLYTSGTTSAPKGVPVIYRPFLGNARLSAAELGLTHESILLSAAPFTHLYGLFSLNLSLATGATTALLPAFSPADLADALRRLRPTALFGAPAHIASTFAADLLDAPLMTSLRFAMLSGSHCPSPLAQRLQDLMPAGKVLQLWGMSEMQAGAFTRPSDMLADRVATAGRASPGTSLRVVDANGAPCADDVVGELQAKGSSVFVGYHDNADATAEAFTADGWFRTGDTAAMDARSNVRVTGRLKELINRGGVKFNPADVERVLDQHRAVRQSAVVPMPDPVLGERACCFVVLHPGSTFTLETMRQWLEHHGLSKTKWPERIEIIDEMPMTATRKIVKARLIERLG
jgi:cyclohexanecarboxylate-CoA ligase/acyl-CoA synthetase